MPPTVTLETVVLPEVPQWTVTSTQELPPVETPEIEGVAGLPWALPVPFAVKATATHPPTMVR